MWENPRIVIPDLIRQLCGFANLQDTNRFVYAFTIFGMFRVRKKDDRTRDSGGQ